MVIRGMLNMNISFCSIPAFIGFILDNVNDILYGNTGSLIIDTSSPFVRANPVLILKLFSAS